MPTIEEKAILRQSNYIKNKFKGVREETENVVTLLHDCLDLFELRIKELDRSEQEHFTSLYRKLNNDFEEFQEKLIYIQASIEPPSECDNISVKQPIKGENELQSQRETKSCDIISNPVTIETLSPLSDSSHSFLAENITTAKFDSIAEVAEASKLISYPSFKDLSNASASLFAVTCKESGIYKSSVNASNQGLLATHAGTSSAISDYSSSAMFQNNASPNNMYTYSSNSTSYASINEVEDSTCSLPDATTGQNSSHIPVESFSQTSCHHSLSSSFSDYQSACSKQDNTENYCVNTLSIQSKSKDDGKESHVKKKEISSIYIDCPKHTTATITHVEDPGNFWLRLDNFEASRLSFPKEIFLKSAIPAVAEVGDVFLAPSKSVPFYLRVKVLSADINGDSVKVFFIDHGSTKNVPRKKLRVLPYDAYNIPMQAINCFLADISAPNGIWCYAAIQKLKEFSANSLETHIKCQVDEKYAVQLIATVFDFEVDIGQSLCIDGLANEEKTHLQIPERKSVPDLCDNTLNSTMQTSNQLSTDSGVSVTFTQLSTYPDEAHNSGTLKYCDTEHTSQFQNELQELCSERLVFQEVTPKSSSENQVADLISFVSVDQLQNESQAVSKGEKEPSFPEYNKCLKIGTCKCALHLLIPFPSIKFVEDNMVIVMLSHIVHPYEFYVHMVVESSNTLDELPEQMFNTYNSPAAKDAYSILLDDLRVGMFCAAWFDDGCWYWYRVKVIDINQNFDHSHNVFVQYVDYGNKAWVKNTDLRTLTPEFATYPALSLKCSLAGVLPTEPSIDHAADIPMWTEEAVNAFKSIVSFENCLTAQILDRSIILDEDPLLIFLWDTQDQDDILLNKRFVDSGFAKIDEIALKKLELHQDNKKCDVKILNQWDPMTEEYNNVLNSYGVNCDNIQIATAGYEHKDEQYICKYYSLRGHCPRKNCPYEHVSLGEGGVTRDQDELYSFNCHPPLPEDGSFILIQVSAVISPSFFYAQLPFGNVTVDRLDSRINQGASRECLLNQDINKLYIALNNHYSNKPFDENTTIALSYGTIVVAMRQYDQTWHRARVIDVQDITGPAKVFYVDFGNEEWVHRKNIRKIMPQFLHTPFQAVECCLYDVEPLGFEINGHKWSSYAVSRFKELVSETIMLAHVAYKLNDTLQVSLRRTTQNDHLTIKEHLIREGFGQEKLLIKTKKPASNYIPG